MSSVADPILILRSPEPIRFMTSAIAAFWVCAGVAGEVAFEDCSVAAAAGWAVSAFFLALHSDSSCWTLSGSTPRSMQKAAHSVGQSPQLQQALQPPAQWEFPGTHKSDHRASEGPPRR